MRVKTAERAAKRHSLYADAVRGSCDIAEAYQDTWKRATRVSEKPEPIVFYTFCRRMSDTVRVDYMGRGLHVVYFV